MVAQACTNQGAELVDRDEIFGTVPINNVIIIEMIPKAQ